MIIRIRKYKLSMRKTSWGDWCIVKDGALLGSNNKPFLCVVNAICNHILILTNADNIEVKGDNKLVCFVNGFETGTVEIEK